MSGSPAVFRRVLLKLSGEALLGDRQYGVDPAFCAFIARQVAEGKAKGKMRISAKRARELLGKVLVVSQHRGERQRRGVVEALARRGIEVHGVDLSPEFVALAREAARPITDVRGTAFIQRKKPEGWFQIDSTRCLTAASTWSPSSIKRYESVTRPIAQRSPTASSRIP